MPWHASLQLDYALEQGRSVARHQHSGPLRILQSLYPEGDAVCHNVLVHPPGGLVGGDTLELDIHVEPINAAPSFEACDIVVPQTVLSLLPGTPEVTVVFATSVSDGEPQNMPSQKLTWIFSRFQQEDNRHLRKGETH